MKRLKDKLRKVLNDHKTVTAVAQEMLPTVLYALIEKGHLGDWSPEKDCCLCLTFQQPVFCSVLVCGKLKSSQF